MERFHNSVFGYGSPRSYGKKKNILPIVPQRKIDPRVLVRSLSMTQVEKWITLMDNDTATPRMKSLIGNRSFVVYNELIGRRARANFNLRDKTTTNVDRELLTGNVSVTFPQPTTPVTSVHGGESVDFVCRAGVARHKSENLSSDDMFVEEMGVRTRALVRQDVGKCAPTIRAMPHIYKEVDYSPLAWTMARAVGDDLDEAMLLLQSDHKLCIDVRKDMIRYSPEIYRHFPCQSEKYRIPPARPKYPIHSDAFMTKERLAVMLSSFKSSYLTDLSASHLDGIPLSPVMRDLFDKYQDYKYVSADVYLCEGSSVPLYIALFKHLQSVNVTPFILVFIDPSLDTMVGSPYVTLDSGKLTAVKQTYLYGVRSFPPISKYLVVSYASFDTPSLNLEGQVDDMSKSAYNDMHARVHAIREYTHVQFYLSFYAVDAPTLQRGKKYSGVFHRAPLSYSPSVLGRTGYCRFVSGQKGFTGKQILEIISHLHLNSVLYVMSGHTDRMTDLLPFPEKVVCNFGASGFFSMLSGLTGQTIHAIGETAGGPWTQHYYARTPDHPVPTPPLIIGNHVFALRYVKTNIK